MANPNCSTYGKENMTGVRNVAEFWCGGGAWATAATSRRRQFLPARRCKPTRLRASAESGELSYGPWEGNGTLRKGASSARLGWTVQGPCSKGLLWSLAYTAGERVGFSDGAGGDGVGGGGDGGYGGSGNGSGGGDGDLGGDQGRSSPQLGTTFWLWYSGVLESHPLITKSLTAGVLNAIADIFCQVFIEKLESIDWKRLLSFVAVGLFMSGPGLHYWYGILPKLVTLPGVSGLMLRIAVDQFLFTPLGMLSYFVVLLTLEDRKEYIGTKLEKDWYPTVVANWKVWIPFQVINFGIIPPQLQVAAAGLLGMVWSVFMSYKGHT